MNPILENCPLCGRLYIKNNAGLCPACYEIEEKQASIAIAYLHEHPNATLIQIHQATGIKKSVILHMIKTGRLIGVPYPCEHCGAPIYAGALCGGCAKLLTQELKQSKKAAMPTKNKGVGMYTKHMGDR